MVLRSFDLDPPMYGRGDGAEVILIRADDQVLSAKPTLYHARAHDVGSLGTTQKYTDCTCLFLLERLDVAANKHSGQQGLQTTTPPDLSNHRSRRRGYLAESQKSSVARPHPASRRPRIGPDRSVPAFLRHGSRPPHAMQTADQHFQSQGAGIETRAAHQLGLCLRRRSSPSDCPPGPVALSPTGIRRQDERERRATEPGDQYHVVANPEFLGSPFRTEADEDECRTNGRPLFGPILVERGDRRAYLLAEVAHTSYPERASLRR